LAIPGVGIRTAETFVAWVDDVTRFGISEKSVACGSSADIRHSVLRLSDFRRSSGQLQRDETRQATPLTASKGRGGRRCGLSLVIGHSSFVI
jgi:transposase